MINRRDFIKKTSLATLAASFPIDLFSKGNRLKLPFQIDNPYQHVKWRKARYIPSTTHIHLINQEGLDKAYELGYRHLPISNYYPSAPYYPVSGMKDGQFRVGQSFGTMSTDPQKGFIEGPLDWNKIIMDKETGWYDSLPDERKAELPFTTGDAFFNRIPADIIFAPNAEHHSFTNARGAIHLNSVGSFFSSGTFDAHNRFQTVSNGYSFGAGERWQDTCTKILKQLQFKDGGGITINHPTWGEMTLDEITELLDFDPRILGIEVFEDSLWSTEIWDRVLQTGRRCLGFSVPDWGVQATEHYRGFNLLLVDDTTEHACMKAYREGTFFGSEYNKSLRFSEITLRKSELRIKLNEKADISFITDKGISKSDKNVTTSTFTVPMNEKLPTIKYVRVEATRSNEERIFSQPIRFIV